MYIYVLLMTIIITVNISMIISIIIVMMRSPESPMLATASFGTVVKGT